MQTAGAGEHRAEDAQAGDESRDEHGRRAVTLEESIELGQASGGEADFPAVSFGQGSPSPSPDQKADVVSDHRGNHGGDHDPDEREPSELRQGTPTEEHGFAWHRQSGVLQQDADEHDRVAVTGKEIQEPFGHAL